MKSTSVPTQGSVATRLRQLTSGKSAIDVGQFRFIGMERIAASYGETWAKNRSEALDTAHGIVLQQIGPNDIIVRGDDGFVLIAGSAVPEAERLAQSLTGRIEDYFLGEAQPAAQSQADSDGDVDFFGPASTPAPSDGNPLTALDWFYQPVWDAKREVLGIWNVLACKKGTDEPVPGYMFDTFNTDQAGFEAIDEAALLVSEQTIRRLAAAGQKAIIGVPVHISSLTTGATRSRIISVIDRLSPDLSRYRLIKLAGVTPGFPRMYLNEILGALRARAPNIGLGSAWTEPDLGSLAAAGPSTLGFVLSKAAAAERGGKPQTDLFAKVRAGVQLAHAARKPFLVEGVFSKALARELVTLGVDGVSSPMVWPALKAPQPLERWPAIKLSSY